MFICVLGFIRSAIGLIQDVIGLEIQSDIISDLSFTLLFLIALIKRDLFRSARKSLYFFYIPFVLLLLHSFIIEGGIQGNEEHNIYGGLIVIIFTLRGWLPVYFGSALFLGVLYSLIYLEIENAYLNQPIAINSDYFNFMYSALALIGITYYAKDAFSSNRKRLKVKQEEQEKKLLEIQKKNDELEAQKEAIEILTLSLEGRVKKRTEELKLMMRKREEYLSVIINELLDKSRKTINKADDLHASYDKDPMVEMLARSAGKLREEIVNLKEKVDADNE